MGTRKPPAGDGGEGGKGKRGRRTWPYKFAMVPLDHLSVDHAYQRPLTSFADDVIANYDPALVGTLTTSERAPGHLAVIDGQTRLEGMRANGEPKAPCLVYTGLTREQEAQLFADLQTKRRGMATYLRFRAALVAKDREAMAIREIVQRAGFELDVEETSHTIKSIAALETVYRKDAALLALTMAIIQDSWPAADTEYRTGGDLIKGLALFLEREQRVDYEVLSEKLSAVTPRMIRHRANALMEGGGGGGGRSGYMADAILGVYMRGKGRGASAA